MFLAYLVYFSWFSLLSKDQSHIFLVFPNFIHVRDLYVYSNYNLYTHILVQIMALCDLFAFFTWLERLEVFNHHELFWNQSNPIRPPWQPFKGRVCHRCSKRSQKNMKKSTTIIFVDLAAARWASREMGPAVRLVKHSKDWAIEIHNLEILSYRHWITERSYNIEPNLNYKNDYRTWNYLNELLNTNTVDEYIIESRYTTTKVKIIHFQCYRTDILLWEFKFCLILDAIEAWLLLKLPLKIWTIRSNQSNTHFAKWLARYRGGFENTKFIDQFCPI